MLRATLVLFTALFAVIILKMKLFKHHYFALIVICIGLAMVGVSSLDGANEHELEDPKLEGKSNTAVVGIIVLLTGQIFGALSYIFEEKYLSDFDDVHPLIVVGWEGVWGTMIMTVMLAIFQFIPCSNPDLCSGGVIENSLFALQEIGSSNLQIIFTAALLPLVCFYNTSGTSVTAYGSAAARCTIE
jgi:drug/metabolite transporter (DMT)-like permease